MRRRIFVLAIIGSFLLGSILMASPAFAPPGEKQGKLQEIWDAIFGLQSQIDELSTRVTALENPPTPPQATDIIIGYGTSVPGCEETNSCYVPFSDTVPVNTDVTWTNIDDAAHTVTSGNPAEGPSGVFDSNLIAPSKSFSYLFGNAGTFDYFCMVHPWMTGKVIVV